MGSACSSSQSVQLENTPVPKSQKAAPEILTPANKPSNVGAQKPVREGQQIPSVIFKARIRDPSIGGENPFTWKDVKTADLFKGKRCVLFALPGAFTPTCSSTHVPGYEKHYDEIKACGIDEIYCLSVNDAFVMRQWGLKLGLLEESVDNSNPLNPGNFQKVKLIPDGACQFTRGMGMSCTWDTERGFGERSWRYSAVINNEKVEKMFIEVPPCPLPFPRLP